MPPPKSEPTNLPPPTRHSSSPPPSPISTTPPKMEPQTSSSAPKPDPTSTPVPPEAKPMNLTSDADNAPPSAQPPPTPPSQPQDLKQEAPLDPVEQIPAFDWQQLHESYHYAMNEASKEEAAMLQEYAALMDVRVMIPRQCTRWLMRISISRSGRTRGRIRRVIGRFIGGCIFLFLFYNSTSILPGGLWLI